MARLQILELPEGGGDDRPPFVLVVDEYVVRRYITGLDQPEPVSEFDGIAEKVGARAVLVFEETIDLPANDTSAYLRDSLPPDAHYETAVGGRPVEWTHVNEGQRLADERTDIARDMDRLAKWRDELADALGIGQGNSWDDIRNAAAEYRSELIKSENAREHLRQARDEARSWARHGYEIGQKHCGWTDHGVAPDWLTEGWPNSFDSCEHLKRAAEYDEALTRVRNLPDQPQDASAEYENPNAYLLGYLNATKEAKRAITNPLAADA